MLKWCSYCQRFLGETPDFHNLNVTHGICTACAPGAAKFTESDFQLAESLRDIQHQLREAGRRSDLHAAERIIENAAAANVRAVDVLIGIIAPALYQVGEDWRRGIIGVAEEHRFTAFCEELFNRVASRVKDVAPAPAADQEPSEFLLMNAPGNKHTLAIRILTLWLRSRGAASRVLDSTPSPEELAAMVIRNPPKSLPDFNGARRTKRGRHGHGAAHLAIARRDTPEGDHRGIRREARSGVGDTGRPAHGRHQLALRPSRGKRAARSPCRDRRPAPSLPLIRSASRR